MDEMRRLGAGTLPTGPRRDATVKPRPLVERINAPRAPRESASNGEPGRAAAVPREGDRARVSGFLRALEGVGGSSAATQNGDGAAAEAANPSSDAPQKSQRRPSLIERITRAEKPVA